MTQNGSGDRDLEREMSVGRRLGFVVNVTNDNPHLIWLDGEGALSRHHRGATEAEVRMWAMLVGMEYQPWSATGKDSKVRNQLLLKRIGMPLGAATDDETGSARSRGESGA